VSKFRTKVPHLCCDSHTSFKIKRSKVKVTRSITVDTHRAPHLPNGKAYEVQTSYTDGERRPASATGAVTSKVKGQGRKVTWRDLSEPSLPNAVPVSLAAGGGIPCRPNPAATLIIIIIICTFLCLYCNVIDNTQSKSIFRPLNKFCRTSSAYSECTRVIQTDRRKCDLNSGDRAFAVAGPRAWNSLPSDIRTSTPLFDTFKKHLKSYLFQLSFSSL